MRIILDMDEVLTDFVGGALKIHGWQRKDFEKIHPKGKWSMIETLGLSVEEFWEPIHYEGSAFWANLELLPWASDLIHLINDVADEWFLVSSPSLDESCHTGKIRWARERDLENRLIVTRYKYLFAQPDVLLIDDRASTVNVFIEYGGEGIIFPTLHNGLHRYKNDPISYLKTTDLIGRTK